MAYCFTDKRHRLKNCGGSLATYGLDQIKFGDSMQERLPFLEGVTVGPGETIILPIVALTTHVYADVHIVGSKTGIWLIFLDKTAQAKHYQALLQEANETTLVREQLTRATAELEDARNKIALLRAKIGNLREPHHNNNEL